jgi:hypothetical protein
VCLAGRRLCHAEVTCSTSWNTPNSDGYAGQPIFVFWREDDVYLVPFVEDEYTAFLKTIIPSRKATKEYLDEESDHED